MAIFRGTSRANAPLQSRHQAEPGPGGRAIRRLALLACLLVACGATMASVAAVAPASHGSDAHASKKRHSKTRSSCSARRFTRRGSRRARRSKASERAARRRAVRRCLKKRRARSTASIGVVITSAPAGSTSATSATFNWTTSGRITRTSCKLDGGSFGSCSAPRSYSNLAPGAHTFTVKVSKGNASASDSASWTITASTPPPAACADGADNDGDGKVDYPGDPGCSSSTDTDETDPAPSPSPQPGTYVFQDEFNGTNGAAPDQTKWAVENRCPTSQNLGTTTCLKGSNVFLDGSGHLVLRVSPGTMGRAYDGARVSTFVDGTWPPKTVFASVAPPVHIEASAKPPRGGGVWPAFWPMGVQSSSGVLELDIQEMRMAWPTVNTCHVHGPTSFNASIDMGVDLSLGYHTYWADYYPDHVTFGVDGAVCGRASLPRSEAVGMRFWNVAGDPCCWGGQGGPPPASALPADYMIDYVRAWKL